MFKVVSRSPKKTQVEMKQASPFITIKDREYTVACTTSERTE